MRKQRCTKTVLEIAVSTAFIICAIKFSKECAQGVYTGVLLCVKVLVPSLFVFMIIASFISQGTLSFLVNKILKAPTKRIFNLPQSSSFLLILSILGGYPVGAKGIETLYNNGELSESEAKKLSYICVCASPAFCINFVALSLYENKTIGAVLLTSQIIAFYITAFIVGRTIKINITEEKSIKIKTNASLIDAVNSASISTINMCAMVIAFSAFIAVLNSVLKKVPELLSFLVSISEVSLAVNKLANEIPLYAISFILGFGGLCVHFQVFSILKEIKINKFLFFLFRIIQGIISAFITYILLIFFPISTQVFSTVNSVTPAYFSTIWGGVALVITAVCFINSINKEEIIRR